LPLLPPFSPLLVAQVPHLLQVSPPMWRHPNEFPVSAPSVWEDGHPPVSDRTGKTLEFPLKKTTNTAPMIRILTAIAASAFAFISASCCCTGEARAPGLRPLPQFQEIQSAPEVHYSK
jgi:hypothetical protein